MTIERFDEGRRAAAGIAAPWRRRARSRVVRRHGSGCRLAATIATAFLLVAGCAATPDEMEPTAAEAGHDGEGRHLEAPEPGRDGRAADTADIPAPVTTAPSVPEPAPVDDRERYTVVVNQVPVRELLFALARDADIEIDIVGDIEGEVTLNAIDQTLPRLLERIAIQAPIRYRLEEDYLEIAADEPYLETYPISYVNIDRSVDRSMDTSTEIEQGALGETGGQGNISRTEMRSESRNRFWHSLERNLANMLDVEVSSDPDEVGSRHVIVNRESGYIMVRATQRQHREVQRYLDRVISSARRQVLIEATVVEVQLSDRFQTGVDWSLIAEGDDGFDFVQNVTGAALGGALNIPDPDSPGEPAMTIGYRDPDSSSGDIRATVKMLETFGDVRVVSSPRITALNNQQSILKVVDNTVFFTVEVQTTTRESLTDRVFETQVNTVPVGLVMSVTPYIGRDDEVLLNVRPTVSRILSFVQDPNPELADAGVVNEIPEIQVRELESLLRVQSGQTAVLGGLMQDSVDETRRGLPGLSRLPLIGRLFSYRDDEMEKTELVVFLRPTIVREASLDGDFRDYQQFLRGNGALERGQ